MTPLIEENIQTFHHTHRGINFFKPTKVIKLLSRKSGVVQQMNDLLKWRTSLSIIWLPYYHDYEVTYGQTSKEYNVLTLIETEQSLEASEYSAPLAFDSTQLHIWWLSLFKKYV